MSFFFYFLGYDSHDGPDNLRGGHTWKKRRQVQDEEELLRYLLKQHKKKPKLVRKLNKDSIRATLERNFKGDEAKELLAVVALPQVISAKDLIKAFQTRLLLDNKKKMQLLMILIILDAGEDEEKEYEH